MRAKFVNENINFERGRDPKDSLGIGLSELVKKYKWDNPFWKEGPEGNTWYKLIRFINIIWWKGIPILVLEVYDKDRDIQGYMAMSDFGSRHKLGAGSTFVSQISPETAVKNLKRMILKKYQLRGVLEESVNFERNRDPKRSLEIGVIKANKDPNRRLHNFSMAFPEVQHPYNSSSTLMAPGSHPKWQIINTSVRNPKDGLSVEERAKKYMDWLERYTDFDIIEINHANERKYHPFGDESKPEQTNHMINIRMRNKNDMTEE